MFISNNFNTSLTTENQAQLYFHRRTLARARYRNHHGKWASSPFQLPSMSGRTIMVRRWNHLPLATTALTEGVAPAGQTPSHSDVEARLVQHGDFVSLTDYVTFSAQNDLLREFTDLLGDQEGYTIDAVDRDTATAGTNVVYSNGSARSQVNSIISSAVLDRAIRTLLDEAAEPLVSGTQPGSMPVNANVFPTMPAYPAVISPSILFDLQNLPDFKFPSQYPGAMPDEVGRYRQLAFFCAPDPSSLGGGAKVFLGAGAASTTVKNTGGNADVHVIMIFAQGGFMKVPTTMTTSAFYAKPFGSAGTADPLDQIATLGWKTNTLRMRANENWLCRIETAVSL